MGCPFPSAAGPRAFTPGFSCHGTTPAQGMNPAFVSPAPGPARRISLLHRVMRTPEDRIQARLDAARLLGIGFIAALGQLIIDMPGGWFGLADDTTRFGEFYGAFAVATGFVLAFHRARGAPWVRRVASVVLTLHIGAFLPALAVDPLVSGIVVLWCLMLLARLFFPTPVTRRSRIQVATNLERPVPREELLDRWFAGDGRVARHLTAVTVVVTIAITGFAASDNLVAQVGCLVLNLLTLLSTLGMWRLYWKDGRRRIVLLALPLLSAAWFPFNPQLTLVVLALYQVILLVLLVGKGPLFRELAGHFLHQPGFLVLSTFALLILLGTLLLSFPAASTTGNPVAPVDALFTATSAVCVTGLIVLDTPVAFTTFGHVVVLLLIQAGALGIMVLGTFATLLVGGRLGLRGEAGITELMALKGPAGAYRLTRFVVLATLAIEGIGAVLLTIAFRLHGEALPQALWKGVFHAVSAFGNAGFALQSDSVQIFRSDPFALTVLAALIVLGGTGFLVLSALWLHLRARATGARSTLSVHSRIVLWTTAALVLSAIAWYAALEWNHTLADLSLTDRLANAMFMGVSLRTAGFNSVDLETIAPATLLLTIVYMYIGGSPGGTAGGIKTTTVVLLLAAIPAISRGEPRVVLGRRTIAQSAVYRAAAIAVIFAGVFLTVLLVLLVTMDLPFEVLAFDAMSATGTVGLSVGAIDHLSDAGKLLVSAVMFIGRTGPLTIALLLTRTVEKHVRHPETDIMVG